MSRPRPCWARNALAPVLVVARKGWHPGVVGLAAARLKERFNLPSFVLAEDTRRPPGRGLGPLDCRRRSRGRGARGASKQGIIVKGGGHAMAAGLTLEVARLGDFRAFLEERLAAGRGALRQDRRCPSMPPSRRAAPRST